MPWRPAVRPPIWWPKFALPVPSLVICELLGVPYDDRDDFQHRSTRQLDLSLPIAERMQLQQQSRDYMRSLVARARKAPGEDILGMLVREHGDSPRDDELVGIAGLLLLAGHETTSNMLGLGTLALLRRPDQLATGATTRTPSGPAMEELLRWLSVVHQAPFRGSPPPTWSWAVCGSRPAHWSSPRCPRATATRVSSTGRTSSMCSRGAPGHLAFGHGVHHCLGAPLAPDGDAHRLSALLRKRFPRLGVGGTIRRCRVPGLPLHLRTTVATSEVVTMKAEADQDSRITAATV